MASGKKKVSKGKTKGDAKAAKEAKAAKAMGDMRRERIDEALPPDITKAMGHALRRAILSTMAAAEGNAVISAEAEAMVKAGTDTLTAEEKEGVKAATLRKGLGGISPNELSKELEEGLSQVSYHVKVLKDFECIVMVKTEPRRGAVEHYYQRTDRMRAFEDTMTNGTTDDEALDAVAAIVSDGRSGKAAFDKIREILVSSGRPC